MDDSSRTGAGRKARLRGLVGFAGMAVACVVLASVTVLFGQASSMPWLPETPSNVAAMQRCEALAGTAPRRTCAERVVSTVLAREPASRLAQSGSEPPAQEAPAAASLQ